MLAFMPVFVGNQAAGAVGQAVGEAHLLHPVLEGFLDELQELLELLCLLPFFGLMLLLFLLGAELHVAAVHRLQFLAVVFGEALRHPFVHRVEHEEHLVPL